MIMGMGGGGGVDASVRLCDGECVFAQGGAGGVGKGGERGGGGRV